MNERIKELRNYLGLTQQQFADKLRVKRNTVATYEIGRSEPSTSAIALICREFGVSEKWLRYGDGDMFTISTRSEEIAGFVSDVLSEEDESFKKSFISILSKLSENEWKLLEKMALSMLEELVDNASEYTIQPIAARGGNGVQRLIVSKKEFEEQEKYLNSLPDANDRIL